MTEMTEQAKAAQRAYKREWARKNPDKVREQRRRYWEHKAAQAAAKATSQESTPSTEKAPSA